MMWVSRLIARHAAATPSALAAFVLCAASLLGTPILAQPADSAALKAQVERRYEVLPLREGVVLRPRTAGPVRSIDISGGAVALDGQPVTGAELRSRLGADADLVLQLSYLDPAQRRALFDSAPAARGATLPATGSTPPAPPAPPAIPDAPAPPAPPEPPRPPRERGHGDRVRFGGNVDVDEGESVDGDVVVIGGSAQVDGEVLGDVVVVGGSLRLGPKADVTKDAVVVGGTLERAPGARVGGKVENVSVGGMDFGRWRFPRGPAREAGRGFFGRGFSVISTLVRVGVLCLLTALMVLFARDYVDRVGARAVAEPLKAGAIGLLSQLLFLPLLIITIVVFVITIVGIPLLALIPFGVLALLLFALAGFTAVASYVGRRLTGRLGWSEYGPIATTVLGVVTIAAPLVLARLIGLGGGPLWVISLALGAIGFVLEYVAWTVGMGAVALARFSPERPANGGMVLPEAQAV